MWKKEQETYFTDSVYQQQLQLVDRWKTFRQEQIPYAPDTLSHLASTHGTKDLPIRLSRMVLPLSASFSAGINAKSKSSSTLCLAIAQCNITIKFSAIFVWPHGLALYASTATRNKPHSIEIGRLQSSLGLVYMVRNDTVLFLR